MSAEEVRHDVLLVSLPTPWPLVIAARLLGLKSPAR
jgi:hypothetical protein